MKIIAALTLMLAVCTSTTIITDKDVKICKTCCYNGNCTVFCSIMLNHLAREIAHWREEVTPPPRDDYLLASLMMVVTEIAEAAEDVRYGRRDHLPEELADAMIRLLGICGRLNVDIESAIRTKMERNRNGT